MLPIHLSFTNISHIWTKYFFRSIERCVGNPMVVSNLTFLASKCAFYNLHGYTSILKFKRHWIIHPTVMKCIVIITSKHHCSVKVVDFSGQSATGMLSISGLVESRSFQVANSPTEIDTTFRTALIYFGSVIIEMIVTTLNIMPNLPLVSLIFHIFEQTFFSHLWKNIWPSWWWCQIPLVWLPNVRFTAIYNCRDLALYKVFSQWG